MDIKLHYTEQGSGTPLILLHGNGEDSGYFVHQIEYFKDRYQVIAIDTRGHGQSPRGEKPFTIRQFAGDLHDFMDELSENKDPDFIKMKKLVIARDKDMIKDEHTRLIYASLPNAEIRVLHGTHFIAKEEYREFNRVVEEFFETA